MSYVSSYCARCKTPWDVVPEEAGREVLCPRCAGLQAAEAAGTVAEAAAIDRELGQIAVRLNMLTPEQVTAVLADTPAVPGRPGAPFVDTGLLDADQLDFLLATLRFKEERVADCRFGKLAIERGWATAAQVDAALAEQKRLFMQEHRTVLLGDLLTTRPVLSRGQCNALLAVQRRLSQAATAPAVAEPVAVADTPVPAATPDAGTPVEAAAPSPQTPAAPAEPTQGFTLTIADDRLSATVTLTEDGVVPTVAQLREALARQRIIRGIDEGALALIAAGSCDVGESVVVARGIAPRLPRDAEIELLFQAKAHASAVREEGGIIDFRDRGQIAQVAEGVLLARRVPPVTGEAGVDVYGVPLSVSPPKDRPLAVGKGVALSPDKLSATAAVSGHPAISATGTLSVFPEYAIQGDVDFSTGHVDFHGRVVVHGAVRSGFRVRCGELEAQEIEGAEVEASGDVVVNGGVIGAHIRSGGSVVARYLHRARLEVMGDVVVGREVVDSEVECSGAFQGNRCKVLSSHVAAMKGVQAKEIGSDTSSPCRIVAGLDERVQHETQRLEAVIAERVAAIKALEAQLAELPVRRAQNEAEVGKTAQVQDRAMVRKRELQKALAGAGGGKAEQLAVELKGVDQQIAQAEVTLGELFAEQDRIAEEITALQARIDAEQPATEEVRTELTRLRDWAREQGGRPVVKADALYQQTMIKTPHMEVRVASDRRRVNFEEREIVDRDGRAVWRLE